MKFSKAVMAAVMMIVVSTGISQAGALDQLLFGAKAKPEYAPLPPAQLYSKEEFEALADNPKLVVLVGRFHEAASKNEDVIIEKYRKTAGKTGAEGLYVLNVRTVKTDSAFSKSKTEKQKVMAESFRFEEPTLDKIKFILEKRAETFSDVVVASDVYIKSIMHHIVAQKYTELGDYILKLIIESPKYLSNEKIIMLDGYKSLLGDRAIDGIKQVKVDRHVEAGVRTHALALLTVNGSGDSSGTTSSNGDDKLYKLIVTSSKQKADLLIFDYTKDATSVKVEKLRKLMKNHPSEIVRTEAGRTLVRLKDTEYVENALQAERSEKVVTEIKKEMLL